MPHIFYDHIHQHYPDMWWHSSAQVQEFLSVFPYLSYPRDVQRHVCCRADWYKVYSQGAYKLLLRNCWQYSLLVWKKNKTKNKEKKQSMIRNSYMPCTVCKPVVTSSNQADTDHPKHQSHITSNISFLDKMPSAHRSLGLTVAAMISQPIHADWSEPLQTANVMKPLS